MSDGDTQVMTRPDSNDRARRWPASRLVAVSMELIAGLLLIWYTATALLWRVYFEPSEVALFQAKVGSALLSRLELSAIVLLAGIALSRPSLWGGPRAYLIGGLVAALSMSLTVAGVVQAERRLHPSFAPERAAVRAFTPSSPDRIDTEVRPQQVLTAYWYLTGSQVGVCDRAAMSFTSWAEPGSVRAGANARFDHSTVGRRGPDDVELQCQSNPDTGRVNVQLTLSRARPR